MTDTDRLWLGFLLICGFHIFLGGWLASINAYDKETGEPHATIKSLPPWIIGNIVIGIAIGALWEPFGAILILAMSIPFTIGVYIYSRPENVEKSRAKVSARKAKEAAEAAALEQARARSEAEEVARRNQETAAAALRDAEAQHPDANLEAYKTFSPNEISETARKLAEKMRPQ